MIQEKEAVGSGEKMRKKNKTEKFHPAFQTRSSFWVNSFSILQEQAVLPALIRSYQLPSAGTKILP